MKLLYRPQFLIDVTECADYLVSEANEKVAGAWHLSLRKTLAHIQRVPEIGRVRQDLPMAGIRTLNLRQYPNYIVFYQLVANEIELLRVRHGMMNLADLFSEK